MSASAVPGVPTFEEPPGEPAGAGTRLLRASSALAGNLVPLAGVLWLGWSAATLLVVFWVESVLAVATNALRIRLHRSRTRASGHYRPGQLGSESSVQRRGAAKRRRRRTAPRALSPRPVFLREYVTTAGVFTAAHGVFLLVLLWAAGSGQVGGEAERWAVDPAQVRNGALALAAVLGGELLLDLPTLGDRPFAWVKARAEQVLGRVLVLHLVLIFGTFAMMRFQTPTAMLAVLVGLKAVIDVGRTLPQGRLPEHPPRWLAALAHRQNLDMEGEWQHILREQRETAAEDELPRAAPGTG